ncbi:unnamed protein product [Polarella glacialis]|uniref:Uncharacterized protein n=1 Tax=Polarella glacialis TaxID=89957 RepID=A0A813I5J3_POLGL|nr:unnamed protein product [Polarella glacialis]
MSPDDIGAWVCLVLIYITLPIYVVLVAKSCFENLRHPLLRGLAWKVRCACSRAWGTLTRRLHISREEDKVNSNDCNAEAAVEEIVDWMNLETVRYALFGVSPFAAVNLMAEVILTHGDWNNYSKTGQFRIYHSHILTLLMILICATICLIWRSQPGRVIRSFFNIFVLVRLCMMLFKYKSVYHLLFDRTDVLAFRFAMSFATGQPGLTAVLNLVYTALSCHVYKGWVANTPETSTLFGPDSVIEFVCQEFNVCFLIILVGWVADMRVFSQARTLIEIKASRATHSSLLMLLSTVCDVVVQLDADFRLVENGERLAAMLLQGAERSLKGICFEDFLFEAADKERLKKHVGRLRNGILGDLGMAIPIHVRMRDSTGCALEVELVHSTYEHPDGRLHHFLGLREVIDMQDSTPLVSQDRGLTQGAALAARSVNSQ